MSKYNKNVKLAKKIEGDRINKIEMDIAEIKNTLKQSEYKINQINTFE